MSAQQVINLLKEDEYVDYDDVSELLSSERDFLEELLTFYSQNENATGNLLDLLKRFHWDTSLTNVLKSIINDGSEELKIAALQLLGFVDPFTYLELVAVLAPKADFDDLQTGYKAAFELASEELSDQYYGDMCPGQFNILAEDKILLEKEYQRYNYLYMPLRQFIKSSQALDTLDGIFETFEEYASKLGIKRLPH